MRYIGLDIGDGESAVALYQQGSGIEPVILPIEGVRSLLSAVGLLHGEIVIGEQAYTSALAENLSVRFKSRFTDDPQSYETMTMFVRGILRALRESQALQGDDRFVVGCPAGWNAAARARYRDLLLRAGMPEVQVISESRAAFLYAKYAKTVSLDLELLRQSALVIDIGSSTLDFAYIVDGRETGVGTFGETHLGGGLLDETFLRRAVERSREREAIQRVLDASPSWRSYLEIEARKIKEQFYSRVQQEPGACVRKTIRVCYSGTQRLLLSMDAEEASAVADESIEALQGQCFSQALFDALANARQITSGEPPKLLLLTGGASRMPFFQEQCREVFGEAVIVICPEPEFSIAKGLAYAGWVDDNLRAFRGAIRTEITDERVRAIASNALPELIPAVSDALVALTLSEAAIPIADAWKHGRIATLQQMNDQLQRRVERVLTSPMAEQALAPLLANWMKTLNPALQAMIDPLCDRYSVPRDEMLLRFAQDGSGANIRFDTKAMMGFNLIGTMVGVLLSVVSALLCGGGGIALIASGTPGLLAGAVVGVIIAAFGWPAVTGMIMRANLPAPFRWIDVEKRLQSENTRRKLADSLARELAGSENAFSEQIITGFTNAFQHYLYQIAQAAEIPIQ